ncbi:ABC transporter substrate-binding protein [Brucepastera parasyntrophica]|uniref:ABC transporter substrate-binding protein n=1 Tax=Brucepastera parasyntrophica TaxID=2880008 RepID=UPI00210B1A12|nr:ABC transporter substrate-binding protein [Brucepastera parasyntrophica]ULQ58800.1 ABC transporter substrate-binding protein [Brucepastera parasyntrophica]
MMKTYTNRKPRSGIYKTLILFMCILSCFYTHTSCARSEELSLDELESLSPEGISEILAKTVSKPWRGEEYVPGVRGGTWNTSLTSDPKSFNLLISERDSETSFIVRRMHDTLVDYDYIKKEFVGHCAAPEIIVDEKNDTLSVIYTLRDDLYWSFYNSDEKVKVTSDDVIFWYNEIEGDPAFQSSMYNSQFVTMPDGSEAHIDIEKIDDLRFAFHFPRIIANPLLATNRDFGPSFLYEKAKREGGVQGVLDLFSVASDPKLIPSMGMWFLTEYKPGQRLVYKRNPSYWKKDSNGISIPYPEEMIVQILPDTNTQFLLFKQGKLEAYGLRTEDINELVNKKNPDYTIFNTEGSLATRFWSFNQNPKHSGTAQYEWFTQKEFRQAMSCLLNRDRIINQVYRGLAEPKSGFFPEANPYYNPEIKMDYLYDPQRAMELLSSIGIKRDSSGIMKDAKGRAVEFDLTITADSTSQTDIASIIMDDCSKVGITVKIRVVDFQKLVEQMSSTFDWHSLLMGFSGGNLFPSQGINVWPSTGNLHVWYPLQPSPATEWEARLDYLYNEGCYTIDPEKAGKIWDEFQEIILEECPVIYLVRPRSFTALRNKWDFSNIYYDSIGGFEYDHVFLKQK